MDRFRIFGCGAVACQAGMLREGVERIEDVRAAL